MLRFDALAKIAANPLIQTLSTRLSSPRGGPWLVGGAIRDLLSGDRPAGFDILAAVDVMPVAALVAKELGLPLKFVDSSFNQVQIERKDGIFTFLRLSSGESLEDNLLRRDFTVNSLALDLSTLFRPEPPSVIDLNNGLEDLKKKILRPCRWTTITDDPLVVLRGVDLSCRLGYSFVSTVKGQVKSGKVRSLDCGDNLFWEKLLKLLKENSFPGQKLFMEMSLPSKILCLGGEGQAFGSEEILKLRLKAFLDLSAPVSWARKEQGLTVATLAESALAEAVFLLLTLPLVYDEGQFSHVSFSDGDELVACLCRAGCPSTSFLTNLALVFDNCLSLGRRGFPFELSEFKSDELAEESGLSVSQIEAVRVSALILSSCYLAENSAGNEGDSALVKTPLSRVLFGSQIR